MKEKENLIITINQTLQKIKSLKKEIENFIFSEENSIITLDEICNAESQLEKLLRKCEE